MTEPRPLDAPLVRGREMLLFRIGVEHFAAPMATVEEAVDLGDTPVESVPGANVSLRGVFTLRGALVPLYDPRQALGLAGSDGGTALVVRAGSGGGRAAIAVDDVDDVLSVSDAEMHEATRSADAAAIVRGLVQRAAAIIAIVDLHALVAACRGTDGGERT